MTFARILAASLVLACLPHPAAAQIASGKVVHIVVPFAAGGVQDILARSISNELGQALGNNVIVGLSPRAVDGGTLDALVSFVVGPGTVTTIVADLFGGPSYTGEYNGWALLR